MPNPLSLLGIAHTAISLVPLGAALYSFARFGGIDPATRPGRVYLVGLVLSVLTAFGLSSTGGFNAGHALGILALLAVFGAWLAPKLSFLGRASAYLATLGWSFSVFLLLVPGINETLTRLPPAQPLASGPDSALVRGALLAWLAIFVLGYAAQVVVLRSRRRAQAPRR
ncbi:hypothetical protein PMI14_05161 [Acidovorax sp. CF316]|uniref:hypothetical protein n=1 Tax=Acidovorax sp. CF316 TaxID=1144317 RepID=UPI00026BBFD4|nr:hypothetical protein [Acidovorax sp. CF316]EJE50245.1 hypothetical protein PMI14_05161 [Acidovorax sp. CF316]